MNRTQTTIFLFVLSVSPALFYHPALAHDLWLTMDSYQVGQNKAATGTVFSSHHFPATASDAMKTIGGRYASKPYNTLENIDHKGGYGGVDDYLVFDARILYKFLENFSVSFGVDNLTDELYHVYHPYSRRVFFTEIKGVF